MMSSDEQQHGLMSNLSRPTWVVCALVFAPAFMGLR